jgi:hypothetical protein
VNPFFAGAIMVSEVGVRNTHRWLQVSGFRISREMKLVTTTEEERA